MNAPNDIAIAQVLAQTYLNDIAGCVPDLLASIDCTYGRDRRAPTRDDKRDAVVDFAQDYIGDRERDRSTFKQRRMAACIIADKLV